MTDMNIGDQILFLRKNKGITQEQLAQKLGITNQAVSKWESGQCMPDIQLLPDIAAFFNVSIDKLMGVEPGANDDDILLTINDQIQSAETGTEYSKVMKIVKALHAIVLVMESRKEESGYPEFGMDETIEHAVCNEWGLSSIAIPQIVTTMRRGNVFFSDDQKLYDENSIKKISGLMKKLSDKLTLTVLFAIYDITSKDEKKRAFIDEICELTDLSKEIVETVLGGDISFFLDKKEDGSFRIKGEYMNLPPVLSVLYPAL